MTESTINDLLDKTLEDWRVMRVYTLELTHGLMGYFPAIRKDIDDIIAVTSEKVIEGVKKMLPERRCHVVTSMALVNTKERKAYSLEMKDAKQFPILTDDDFEILSRTEVPFKWAPGLIS